MQELWKVPGGPAVAANQLLYNLTRHGMTPAQAALAWLLAQEGVIVIPKTGRSRWKCSNTSLDFVFIHLS